MVSSIAIERFETGGTGLLSYTHNSRVTKEIKIRTGRADQPPKSEWRRGISGIPIGHFWLWNIKKYIQQYNDLDATGSEIGRFYPISSDPNNHRIISNPLGNHERWDIGLHDENGKPFSLGCPVIVDNLDFRKLVNALSNTPEGLVRLDVKWK